MKYYKDKNCYQLVRQFHISFGIDYNEGEEWKRITIQERVFRAKLMSEEVMEYVGALDCEQIWQVDALVDLLYFVLGCFAMIGFDPFNDSRLTDMAEFGRHLANEQYEAGNGYAPADRLYQGSLMEWRANDAKNAIELIFSFVQAPSTEEQIHELRRIMDWILVQAAIVGADLYPYFLLAHDSNMSKLWPDGKPRYNSDGKLRKPETFVSPISQMENMMLNDLSRQEQEDDIPF